eukprot:scaffold66368_cov66-Phaeocystis_antarctica.AAC.2
MPKHGIYEARAFAVAVAHIAMSMLRSSTVVSVTKASEIAHAAQGDLVESRAHSNRSLPVNAPSRSVCSVETTSRPPSSSAHPAVSRCAACEGFHRHVCSSPNCCATSEGDGSSSTVQLAAKATSKKSSSTRKLSKSPKSMRKNIIPNGPKRDEMSSTRERRSQSRRTATARSDVAVAHGRDERRKREDQRRCVHTVHIIGPVGCEAVVHTSQPRPRVAAAGGHELAGLPQEPASNPAEQQRRDGRSGEARCREGREREGEGQVGRAREAELDDGGSQKVSGIYLFRQPGLDARHQRHEWEEKEQLQQDEYQDQKPRRTGKVDQLA